MKRTLFSSLVLLIALASLSSSAFAQRETDTGVQVEKDILLLRRNLRAEKKKLIAMNVPLTETEATKFWPVYDQYAEDMRKHNDEFFSIIKDYAANQKTLTDEQAVSMIKRWTDLQLEVAKTRQRYVPLFEKAIPGRKAAHFLQIDRRIYLIMDLQTAAEIPLVLQ